MKSSIRPGTALWRTLNHILAHPGMTNPELATALDTEAKSMAAATSYLTSRGLVTRKQVHRPGLPPVYRYFPAAEGAEPAPRAKPKPAPVAPPAAPAPEPKPAPLIQSLDELVDALARGIVARVMSTVRTMLKSELSSFTAETEQLPLPDGILQFAPEPPRKRLKAVLVVGLLPAQAGAIVTEFRQCFDLRFWKDENLHRLQAMAANADEVAVLIGKVSHKATESLKSMNCKFVPVHGGMTSLRDHLTALYAEE